jgi:Ribbon-helix-helix domain
VDQIFVKVAQRESNSQEHFSEYLVVIMDKQITMKIPDEIYKDLREISMKKGEIPIGELIRRALDDYIRKNKLKGVL